MGISIVKIMIELIRSVLRAVELFGGLGLDEKTRLHQRLGKLKQHLLDNPKAD